MQFAEVHGDVVSPWAMHAPMLGRFFAPGGFELLDKRLDLPSDIARRNQHRIRRCHVQYIAEADHGREAGLITLHDRLFDVEPLSWVRYRIDLRIESGVGQ